MSVIQMLSDILTQVISLLLPVLALILPAYFIRLFSGLNILKSSFVSLALWTVGLGGFFIVQISEGWQFSCQVQLDKSAMSQTGRVVVDGQPAIPLPLTWSTKELMALGREIPRIPESVTGAEVNTVTAYDIDSNRLTLTLHPARVRVGPQGVTLYVTHVTPEATRHRAIPLQAVTQDGRPTDARWGIRGLVGPSTTNHLTRDVDCFIDMYVTTCAPRPDTAMSAQ